MQQKSLFLFSLFAICLVCTVDQSLHSTPPGVFSKLTQKDIDELKKALGSGTPTVIVFNANQEVSAPNRSVQTTPPSATIQELFRSDAAQPGGIAASSKKIKSIASQLYNRFYENRNVVSLVGTVSLYCIIELIVLQAHYKFKNQDTWANWKRGVTLQQLLERPQKNLTQDLLTDIQKRYINPQNPTDEISPLVQFINETTQEKKTLSRYQLLLRPITHFKLSRFFPLSQNIAEDVERRKERLAFVIRLFSSWAAEQKVLFITNTTKKRCVQLMDSYW